MGPTTMGLLARALGHERMNSPEYKKLWRLLDHLLDEGIIEISKPLFSITAAAWGKLAVPAREDVGPTSVRLFERRAA